MEYISVEEFSKQYKEVKKSILNWWKDNITIGDLFNDIIDYGVIRVVSYYDKESKHIIAFNRDYKSYIVDCMPILSEGQLRKFIEDKTGCKIEIEINNDSVYSIYLLQFNNSYYRLYKSFDDIDTNLFKAYWKVACEIAKEE